MIILTRRVPLFFLRNWDMISLMVEIYKSYFYLFNYYCTQLYASRLMPTYNAWFEPDVIDIIAYFNVFIECKKRTTSPSTFMCWCWCNHLERLNLVVYFLDMQSPWQFIFIFKRSRIKYGYDKITGKPVSPEDLKKIELIVNKQIKDELDVYAQEVSLDSAKRINGLRAVFGEVSFPLSFFILQSV